LKNTGIKEEKSWKTLPDRENEEKTSETNRKTMR